MANRMHSLRNRCNYTFSILLYQDKSVNVTAVSFFYFKDIANTLCTVYSNMVYVKACNLQPYLQPFLYC